MIRAFDRYLGLAPGPSKVVDFAEIDQRIRRLGGVVRLYDKLQRFGNQLGLDAQRTASLTVGEIGQMAEERRQLLEIRDAGDLL